MSGLEVQKLSVAIDRAIIVDEVSFKASSGEVVGLIGANGVGKSTLLRGLAGILPATGEVRLDGAAVGALSLKVRARAMAYLPQGQTVHWPIDVHQLVALGRLPHLAPFSRISAADEAAIQAAMDKADVAEFAHREAISLSAGERARVLLARALAVEAKVLLADEPTAALDPLHQLQVMQLLRAEAAAGGLVIVVLHDLALAARFCDRLLLMHEGRLVADGPPTEVLTPRNLEETYQVEGYFAAHDGAPIVLPWRPTA